LEAVAAAGNRCLPDHYRAGAVGEPVLLPLPQWARFAILVPVMVAVMV